MAWQHGDFRDHRQRPGVLRELRALVEVLGPDLALAALAAALDAHGGRDSARTTARAIHASAVGPEVARAEAGYRIAIREEPDVARRVHVILTRAGAFEELDAESRFLARVRDLLRPA
jgi:hypothetical protein